MIFIPIIMIIGVTLAIFKDATPGKKTTQEVYQERLKERGNNGDRVK